MGVQSAQQRQGRHGSLEGGDVAARHGCVECRAGEGPLRGGRWQYYSAHTTYDDRPKPRT